jgi:GntR family transcriptional repressor for pyruvate dehydrogenase complex
MRRYLPVQSEHLYEKIVRQIEKRIVSGDLEVGDQLPPERVLADQFEVSRTAVREATKILREKGLIEIREGLGTFVKNETPSVVQQSTDLLLKNGSTEGFAALTEVREIMESEIAALAASRFTNESGVALQEAYDVMEKAYDNPAVFIEADLDFHLALAEATQNPLILTMLASIIDLLKEERKQTAQVEGGLKRSQIHHKKILEAVFLSNPQAARLAMIGHLEQIRADMGVSLQ